MPASTIKYLTQDELSKLLAVIKDKRERALCTFLQER
jgi:hypothetical protein